MHPGISADASLFADLGVDPYQPGCHSLEATDFLIRGRTPDVSAHLLLWQVECVGDFWFNFSGYKRHNFHILIEKLQMFYPASHPVVIYEAAQMPQGRPKIVKSTLDTITKDDLTGISTLYHRPPCRSWWTPQCAGASVCNCLDASTGGMIDEPDTIDRFHRGPCRSCSP